MYGAGVEVLDVAEDADRMQFNASGMQAQGTNHASGSYSTFANLNQLS